MIKYIVIMDDNPYKRQHIQQALGMSFPTAEVVAFPCANPGLRYILMEKHDFVKANPEEWLIVVDMQMPHLEGGDINVNCGYSVLARLENSKLSCKAIIASSEDINDVKAKTYYEGYIGSVKYSASVDTTYAFKNLLAEYL